MPAATRAHFAGAGYTYKIAVDGFGESVKFQRQMEHIRDLQFLLASSHLRDRELQTEGAAEGVAERAWGLPGGPKCANILKTPKLRIGIAANCARFSFDLEPSPPIWRNMIVCVGISNKSIN